MRHGFLAVAAMAAALALAVPVPAAAQARPRDPGSAPSSGPSGSSGGSGRVSEGSSSSGSAGVQAAPRVGSQRSGSSRSGTSSVRERSVPPPSSGVSTGNRVSTGSRARPRGEGGVVAGTSGAPAGVASARAPRTGGIVGRAVPRSSRPPILRPPVRWYYPGWLPISYYSPWLYGTYGVGYYFYDPWWLIWGPAYGPWGYDPYYYGPGYGIGGGGGYYGGRSTTVSDYGQLRLKVKPADADVFVDGVRKGEVRDFDGVWERLEVPFGTHVIEIRRDGYKSRAWDVTIQSKDLVTIKGELTEN